MVLTKAWMVEGYFGTVEQVSILVGVGDNEE